MHSLPAISFARVCNHYWETLRDCPRRRKSPPSQRFRLLGQASNHLFYQGTFLRKIAAGEPMNNKRSVRERIRLRVSGIALMAIAFSALCPILAWPHDVMSSVVIQWNNAALQGVRDSKIGPPMVARALFIVQNCIYDAWAAYDRTAVGTVFVRSLRRPKSERTLANKNRAISFAAYRAAVDLFPGDKTKVFDPLMASLGYDPNNKSTNTDTPSGVGNVACAAVLNF